MNDKLEKELKDIEYMLNKLTQRRIAILALLSHKPNK